LIALRALDLALRSGRLPLLDVRTRDPAGAAKL
jgi:hypothetical protein